MSDTCLCPRCGVTVKIPLRFQEQKIDRVYCSRECAALDKRDKDLQSGAAERLAAAAPDLLDALEPLLQYAIDVDDTGLSKKFKAEKNEWIKAAEAAIAKAKGK